MCHLKAEDDWLPDRCSSVGDTDGEGCPVSTSETAPLPTTQTSSASTAATATSSGTTGSSSTSSGGDVTSTTGVNVTSGRTTTSIRFSYSDLTDREGTTTTQNVGCPALNNSRLLLPQLFFTIGYITYSAPCEV